MPFVHNLSTFFKFCGQKTKNVVVFCTHLCGQLMKIKCHRMMAFFVYQFLEKESMKNGKRKKKRKGVRIPI